MNIEITDRQSTIPIDLERLIGVARQVLADHGPADAEISIAVVDDPTIHALNRKYLQHDYPTDVLSFVLHEDERRLEGEVVVSADKAAAEAPQYDWSAGDELLLYVIHGMLHLVGFDDQSDCARAKMDNRQQHYLRQLGLEPTMKGDGCP